MVLPKMEKAHNSNDKYKNKIGLSVDGTLFYSNL